MDGAKFNTTKIVILQVILNKSFVNKTKMSAHLISVVQNINKQKMNKTRKGNQYIFVYWKKFYVTLIQNHLYYRVKFQFQFLSILCYNYQNIVD